uniref:Janus kinase and microtubule-interacting protein C-terminal domain-containing protein n=1 Tax=Parascaris univalens TaxID=6257 RepID=A0A915BA12_PARUN
MASSSTPTSIGSGGYGTLSRSACNKIAQKTNSAFGSSLMMNREDHERERLRWQQKLDETESRLAEAEIINSEMNQLKAELNKRIVEMERNQKPLIEQNRRLSERNRLLQNEIKKGEQRLCHSQDDFLTLKDGYERLMKENQSLKEKRAFPEKLEELDRYRNQVLEYSKCITALRQSALESLAKKEGIDKVVETDMWIPEEQCDLSNQIPTTLTFDQICDLKRDLLDLRKLAYLDDFQRSIAHRAQLFIESLENQMLEAEAKNNLQMKNYEAKEAEREKLINDLQAQIEESYSKQKKKKELQVDVENLRKNIAEMENEKQKLLKTINDNKMEMEKQRENLLKENAAKIIEIENAKEALSNRLTAIEQEKECLLRRMAEIEHERDELIKYKGQMHSQNEKLHKQMEQIQNEKVTLMKMVTDAEVKQQTLNEEVNNLSKELGKLRYCLQQKDELIANEKKVQSDLKSNVEEVSKNHQRVVEELRATTVAQKEELEIAKDRLSQLRREKATVEQENAKLLEDLSAVEEENQKLKDDIRPPIKTQLERRFEESRYRLNCALQTVHEYEDEIVKLRRQLAEFETKLEDRSKIENDFAQLREYSQQLEKQFSTQSHLIDALKEKIIQHKKFTDFLSAATDDGEHSCEDIEEKLEHFCESQQDEGNRESTNLLRRLIRKFSQVDGSSRDRSSAYNSHTKVRPYNSADSGEWLSNSSEALASLDERHDLSDDEIEAARRKQIIKNTRG